MKIALLALLMMTTASGVVYAADPTDKKSETFAVEKIICNKSYVPAEGAQSPNYQAGMDVNGQAVAPADLNSVATVSPDYVEVPMTIDLAQRMGLSQVGAEAKLPVANLKLFKDGKVEYNGQDISSNAASLCGVAKKSDAASVNQMEPAAGQDPMITAPAKTANPDPRLKYREDKVAPPEVEPRAGSVAASSTSFPPKVTIDLPRKTVKRADVSGLE